MDVELRSADASKQFTGDLQVVRQTWPHVTTRQFGECVIRIPTDNAEALRVLDRRGGVHVRTAHGSQGVWTGRWIGEPPQISLSHVEITARSLHTLLQDQPLRGGQSFRHLPAGVIAQTAITQVAQSLGTGAIRPGSFMFAPPLISFVRFEGQDCITLLNDLMEQSGQEWEVTADGTVNWRSDEGRHYPTLLSEDADLVYLTERPDNTNRVSQVIPVSRTGREGIVAVAEDLLLTDPRRALLRVDTDSEAIMAQAAREELAARREDVVTYELGLLPGPDSVLGTGGGGGGGGTGWFWLLLDQQGGGGGQIVTPAPHWHAVREGDTILFLVPQANRIGGGGGAFAVGRVLSREWGDDYAYPVLTVYEMRPWDARTIAAARERGRPQYVTPDAWERRLARGAVRPGLISDADLKGLSASKLIGKLLLGQIGGVEVVADDLNKTAVSAWEAGATNNPKGGFQADASAWTDTTAQTEFNALLTKLRIAQVIT